VTGRELPTGEPCAVPLNLVYTAIHRTAPNGTAPPGAYGDEPRTNPLPYAGLAAGTSREQAETNALLELIERDAIATSSLSGARWSEIIVPDALAELFGKNQTPSQSDCSMYRRSSGHRSLRRWSRTRLPISSPSAPQLEPTPHTLR